MSRSKSSKSWLRRHFSDYYVKLSKRENYRSAYKLLEIQEKDKILTSGATVIDLGAAPGGWSEVARSFVGEKGKVFAVDILPIKPIDGVECMQGDFTDEKFFNEILTKIGKFDLVISDMAPNISGIKSIDQPKSMYLSELALAFAKQSLKEGGFFLVKVFQGEGFDSFLKEIRTFFKYVKVRKPKASSVKSVEVYLLAKNLK